MFKKWILIFLMATGTSWEAKENSWKPIWEMSEDMIHWKTVNLPQNLHMDMEDMNSDEIYLRTVFLLEDTFPPPTPLSIRLGIILDRDKLYLNGNKVGETGDWFSQDPQGYDKIRIYDLPGEYLNVDGYNVLFLKVKKFFPDEIGPAQDRIEILPTSIAWREFYMEELLQLGFLIFYLAVSSYFMFLYIRRKKEPEYLFFSLFTLNLILYQFLRTQTKFLLSVDFVDLKHWEYLVLPSFIPFMAHFIRSFLGFTYNRYMKLLDCIVIFLAFVIFIQKDILILDLWNRNIIQPLWILYAINAFIQMGKKIKEGNQDALLLGLGIVSIIISAIVDILGARYVWNFPRISGYVFMGNVLFQAILLANRFVRLNREVEDLNLNLEKKVQDRTLELENSLEKIEAIKNSQDGDYFLTSLLLKHLHTNSCPSDNFKIDILTKQKKGFIFKGKNLEIGGDLSMIDEIELRGEKYIFFMNSDAMGKSIQGAGGALVLGVLIRSILSRQKSEFAKGKYPEKWLKDCFLDIQNAFETFEGSMFVSLIIGLVHKETGYVYFFNAEHPGIVLWREDSTFFLEKEEDRTLRKIGIPENEKNFRVNTYQLNKEEKMILGTDGRDDIDLGLGEYRVINEDENLFLNIVKDCNGDLGKIFIKLESTGKITDDLSLVSLSYIETKPKKYFDVESYMFQLKLSKKYLKMNNPGMAIHAMEKAYKLAPENAQTCELLGRLYYRIESYEISYKYFEKSLKLDPSSELSLFFSAKCLKKLGMKKEAIDMAERIRIRNPESIYAQKILSRLYNKNLITKHSPQNNDLKNDWEYSQAA